MEDVPEFYKLLLSSSTDQHQEERRWILRLIADSLIEPYDYNIMQKRLVVCFFFYFLLELLLLGDSLPQGLLFFSSFVTFGAHYAV